MITTICLQDFDTFSKYLPYWLIDQFPFKIQVGKTP